MADFLKFYDLEHYLFHEVGESFRRDKKLSAFDFFCIVVWKANRAKSRIARRLLERCRRCDADREGTTLDDAVAELCVDLEDARSGHDKLQSLMCKWGFRLPMASAILTVLYPNEFTVFDVRVCEQLEKISGTSPDFIKASNRVAFEAVWKEYQEYVTAVRSMAPDDLTLRNKDRFLWAKSFVEALQNDIDNRFIRRVEQISDQEDLE